MSNEIYMTVNGPDACLTENACSKESVGSFYKTGHEEECFIFGFQHRVSLPTNTLTGQVTGTRKHEYLKVKKLIDKSSPLLLQCVTAPTELEVELHFYRTPDETSGGEPVHYYTIKLQRAKIISVHAVSPDMMDANHESAMAYEEVTFAYGQIQVDHIICGTNAIDDWSGQS